MRDLLGPLLLCTAIGCAHARPGPDSEIRFGARAARHGLWREAVARFERATELKPADARAWNDYAVALEAAGRLEPAFEAYRRAVELGGSNGAARRNLDRFLAHHRETVRKDPVARPEANVPMAPMAPKAPVEDKP